MKREELLKKLYIEEYKLVETLMHNTQFMVFHIQLFFKHQILKMILVFQV